MNRNTKPVITRTITAIIIVVRIRKISILVSIIIKQC